MKLLRVFAVVCGLALSAAALDREAFTFTQYDLDARVEPTQQRLAVRGRLTLRNDSKLPQKNFPLQISGSLNWLAIQTDGKPVQYLTQDYTSDIDHTGTLSEAIVTLSREVPPGGTVALDVRYEGVVPQDATRLTRINVPQEVAKHSDWDLISKNSTAVRGVGYVTWYPVALAAASLSDGNAVFDALARWKAREESAEFTATITNLEAEGGDAPLFLCNGRTEAAQTEQVIRASAASVECRFSPLGTAVPLFVLGEYKEVARASSSVSYLPGHENAAQVYAAAAEKTLPFVTEWLGAPAATTVVVDLADAQAAPYESGRLLLTPVTNATPALAEVAMVHQLAHAAFSSPRPWIAEGTAHFLQAAYRARRDGHQAGLEFMEMHRLGIVEAEKSLETSRKQDPTSDSLLSSAREEFYRSKAMYVWWMLNDMLGDGVLKKTLAAYRAEQDNNPAYLQHLLEAQSKRDLQTFFEDWVYNDRGLPDFRVESVFPRQTLRGGYLVTVTVENLGDAGAEVPVTIGFEGGELTHRLEVKAKSKNSIRFDAASFPTGALVNDGSVPESNLGNNVLRDAQ
jgi:hypothetical protein